MSGKADFITYLDVVGDVPSVGDAGQDFLLQESVYTAFVEQGYLFRVPQGRVWLVFDDGRLALHRGREQAVEGRGLRTLSVNLLDDRRGGRRGPLVRFEFPDFFGGIGPLRVNALQSQRAFHRNLQVAECLVREYPGLLRFLKLHEGVADSPDILLRQFAVFLAHVPVEGSVPLGGVDELDVSLLLVWLAVGQHPDIGGDPGGCRTY